MKIIPPKVFSLVAILIPLLCPAQEKEPDAVPNRLLVKFRLDGGSTLETAAEVVNASRGKRASWKQHLAAPNTARLRALFDGTKLKECRPLFRKGLAIEAPNDASLEALKKRPFPGKAKQRAHRKPAPNLNHVYALEFPDEEQRAKAEAQLRALDFVEYVQPDFVYQTNSVPNDPIYNDSTNDYGVKLWGLHHIGTEDAWDVNKGKYLDPVTSTLKPVIVAVVDSGVDMSHSDLAANIWQNPGEVGGTPGVDDDGNGFIDDFNGWNFVAASNNPTDDHGHGTHVAGTIAAVGNNGIGIIGVAPESNIMVLKGLNSNGSGTTATLTGGIIYAAENGAQVINNSWGPGGNGYFDLVRDDAISAANALDSVVVFSAGNGNTNVSVRGSNGSPEVVSVGSVWWDSTTSSFQKSNFSDHGYGINIAAPGGGNDPCSKPHELIASLRASGTHLKVSNVTACFGTNLIPADDNTSEYIGLRGTSMAAPHVTGVAALIRGTHPDLSREEVAQVLTASANRNYSGDYSDIFGAGVLDAAASVNFPVSDIITPEIDVAHNIVVNPDDGVFPITGDTGDPSIFAEYKMIYQKVGDSPETGELTGWISTPVVNGTLHNWDSKDYREGVYQIVLLVKSQLGNIYQAKSVIQLSRGVELEYSPAFYSNRLAHVRTSRTHVAWMAISPGALGLGRGQRVYFCERSSGVVTEIIPTTSTYVSKLAVSDDLLVYREVSLSSPAVATLKVYKFSTGVTTTLSTPDVRDFALDGSTLVYEGPPVGGLSYGPLYEADLTLGTWSPASLGVSGTQLVLDSDVIYFKTPGLVNTLQIKACNLTTLSYYIAASSSYPLGFYDVSYPYLAVTEDQGSDQNPLKVIDLTNSSSTQLFGVATSPVCEGARIAWGGNDENGVFSSYIHDLHTGITTKISDLIYSAWYFDGGFYRNFDLSPGLAAFCHYQEDGKDHIFIKNISSNTSQPLGVTRIATNCGVAIDRMISPAFVDGNKYEGSVSSISSGTIGVSGVTLTPDELEEDQVSHFYTHYLEIADPSSPLDGRFFNISSNTSSTITLEGDTSGLSAGNHFIVREHRTIADLFPAGISGGTDTLSLSFPGKDRTFTFNSGHWVDSVSSIVSDHYPVEPLHGIRLTTTSAPLNTEFLQSGFVKEGPSQIVLDGDSYYYPHLLGSLDPRYRFTQPVGEMGNLFELFAPYNDVLTMYSGSGCGSTTQTAYISTGDFFTMDFVNDNSGDDYPVENAYVVQVGSAHEYKLPEIVERGNAIRVSAFSGDLSAISLTFYSVFGISYTVEYSFDLETWVEFDSVTGIAGSTTYTSSSLPALVSPFDGAIFWRIVSK